MRLQPSLPATPFEFPRGYGEKAIPFTGDGLNRPASAIWWTKDQVLGSPGLEYRPGSILLGRVDQRPIGFLDNRHVMTIAGSRSGKSATLLIPNLLLWDGSALVIDPKGELATETAARRAAMGQDVRILDPWGVVDRARVPADAFGTFDPLTDLRDDPANLIENAELVADALVIGNDKDAHWTDSARALIRALVLLLVLDEAEGDGTIASLPRLIARLAAEAQRKGADEGASGLLDDLAAIDLTACPDGQREAWAVVQSQALMMLGTGAKERASIFSTARTQLVFLDSPSMARAVASSALVLADLKRRPSTVYLCLPAARMGTHSRWLRLIVNLAMAALEKEPWRDDAASPTGKVPPVLFVLEEFAALGHMRALEQAIAYMGGYGVKLWTVLQDLTQLKRHYKEGWETFLGNSGVTIAFAPGDDTTSEYLSKRLGETTFQITNKVEVNADAAMKGDTGRKFARRSDGKGGTRGGLALVLIAGNHPLVVDRVFNGELVEASMPMQEAAE